MMDYKEWIAQEAEELAQTQFGMPLYQLTPELREAVWKDAENVYTNYEQARLDALFDAYKEGLLIEEVITEERTQSTV